jgi:hypothetical protein
MIVRAQYNNVIIWRNSEADALMERVSSDLPEAMAEIGGDGESATVWPLSTIRC